MAQSSQAGTIAKAQNRIRLRVAEQWLDEGWSPWRIGYGAVALVSTAASVYGYLTQPRHPGAVWWMFAAVCLLLAWSLSEMLRWRTKYKRLQTSMTAIAAESAVARREAAQKSREADKHARLRKLYADGRVLKSTISHYASYDGTLPYNIPPQVVRWQMDTANALADNSSALSNFRKAIWEDELTGSVHARHIYDRIEYQLKVLNRVINPLIRPKEQSANS